MGLGQASLKQLFSITPGTQYTLTFNSFWSALNGDFIGVKFNGQLQYAVDASGKNEPGVWNANSIAFTATMGQYLPEFEWVLGRIDGGGLTPGT